MSDDRQIREKLEKIKALFAGATTPGERSAAQAAMDRLQQRAGAMAADAAQRAEEIRFSLTNPWSVRLFMALCRSKGYKPYRYYRMRHTTLCVRITRQAMDTDLWPEFLQMDKVLTEHLGELADRIIADCINPDRSDAEVVAALPGQASGSETIG